VTPKLLLADDSVTIQRVIELTFADEDVQVLAVGDGQQAIDRVRSERPDIVLADVGMPERDGYEVAAFIKGDPQLAHIPVLLLTGAFEPVDEVRARAVGCDGVLVKPFEPQMVISRVRDLLAGHREPQLKGPVPPPGPIKIAPSDANASSAFEAAAGSLEDYFDRLDAALASKTASAGAPRPEPVPAPAAAGEPVRAKASRPEPHDLGAWSPVKADVPIAAAATVPAPDAPVPAAPPVVPLASPPATEEASLQHAFEALLSAERNTPVPASAPRMEAVPPDLIDDIVRRVIARMGDESMRSAVLDAAERLVREEIARIKSQG
jgi:CheY-like chemotaxis protein